MGLRAISWRNSSFHILITSASYSLAGKTLSHLLSCEWVLIYRDRSPTTTGASSMTKTFPLLILLTAALTEPSPTENVQKE